MSLGNEGEILLITIGDSAFPQIFNENTCDLKEKCFNKKLCSARVVTENVYGMLMRSDPRTLYAQTFSTKRNLIRF